MNIEKIIQEDRQAKLTVGYSQQEFEGYKRKAAKKISKNAKIPGFRPGKAPYNVVVNRYGEGAILEEALEILLDSDYANILKEAEIDPSGPGNLETIERSDPPQLVFLVPLEPEIELGDYKEIRKVYELEEFDLSQVDKFIDQLRRNAATIIPADHPAEEGDLVYFNLSAEFLNPEEGEDPTITDKTSQQVIIPAESEDSAQEWPYPGFARALIGVESGSVKEIQHTYADDYSDEDYRGKTAIFTVEVHSVKELELPEVDEDFVQSQGDFKTPEDFREAIEERLRTQHKETYDQAYFNKLITEIMDKATLSYPPQMFEQEKEQVLEDIKTRVDRQNLDFATYLKLRETDEDTFIDEEVAPTAKERLERSLVIDSLIKAEGLKLDQEKLKGHVNEVMAEIFYSGNAEEMQKQMGSEDFSRAISMEGIKRTMNIQIFERLKLIATGQPIPEDDQELADALEEDDQPETSEELVDVTGGTEETEVEPEVTASEELDELEALDQLEEKVNSDDSLEEEINV